MRALLLAETPLEAALRHGLAPAQGLFRWLVPGVADMPALGLLGGDAARLAELAPALDMIGLESHARPFFIDPLPLHRLQAEYPLLAALRARAVQEWALPSLAIAPAWMAQHRAMRAAMGVAEQAALAHWLAGLDAVLPPAMSRPTPWDDAWPGFLSLARQDPHWAAMPDAGTRIAAFLLRTPIFMRMAGPLHRAVALLADAPAAMRRCFTARLVAMHIRHACDQNPLLRIAEVPLLHETPGQEPPPDFDPAAYLALNPDVARAGVDAWAHWRGCGWLEDREWA